MTKAPVLLLGGGGHASVLAATLRLLGRPIAGCIALERPETPGLEDILYLGPDGALDAFMPGQVDIAVAVGSVRSRSVRARLFELADGRGHGFSTILHPAAIADSSVLFGRGVQIMAGAIVQAGVWIGDNVIVNTGAIIEHGCRIGNHVHVASGAVIAGDVTVGANSHVGAGAVILQGCNLGERVTIGASACVTRNIPGGQTVVGVPAHQRRKE